MLVHPTDDPIIIGHVKSAHEIAVALHQPAGRGDAYSGWVPSSVPSGDAETVYLVVDCNGRGRGCVWREANVGATDLETVIDDLLAGRYSDTLKVIAFNLDEG